MERFVNGSWRADNTLRERLRNRIDRMPQWIVMPLGILLLCAPLALLIALGDALQDVIFGGVPGPIASATLAVFGLALIWGGFKGVLGRQWRGGDRKARLFIVLGWMSFAAFIALGGLLHDPRCYVDWDGRSNPTVCD